MDSVLSFALSNALLATLLSDPGTPEDYFIPIKTLPYNYPADQRSALEAIPGVIVQDTPERAYPLAVAGREIPAPDVV